MQLVPRYLYKNQIDIISNDTGFVVEYRPVYSRQLKVYRGIDNAIQFRALNADQKPVNISTQEPVLVVFDEGNTKILEKTCTVQDDGSTTNTKGMFTVTISENDLLNIKQQYLKYNIYFEGTLANSITYADRNFGSAGIIYVDGTAYPGPKSSVNIVNFKFDNNFWYAGSDDTDKITADPGLNGNEALHTVAVYTNLYVGTLEIQATLDNTITGMNNWTTISTLTFDGTETQPTSANFNGVYSFLRFKASADPENKITKILVRN